jgi:salicylate 5-hydroxylase large subunit
VVLRLPVEPFEAYLGESILKLFDRVFDGRALSILGYSRQLIPANWKLMFENIKDPYHASLLHVFLVSFGLFRATPVADEMDETGRTAARLDAGDPSAARHRGDARSSATSRCRSDFARAGASSRQATVVMQTVANLIVQQQSNTLATRQLVPRGPEAFELDWTFFGYGTDDAAMTRRRLLQANLMGPAGYVSLDDSEVMQLSQPDRPLPRRAGPARDGRPRRATRITS